MNQSASHPSPGPVRGVGYETRDVNPYYVALFGLGLIAMIAIVLVVLAWMFHRLETAAKAVDPPQSPVADTQTPPPPRLQVEPEADLARMRRDQQQVLSSYGWMDRQEQTVRIPIARAIDILAERGFPEPEDPRLDQPQEQAAVATPGRSPGEREGPPPVGSEGQPRGTHRPAQPKEPAR